MKGFKNSEEEKHNNKKNTKTYNSALFQNALILQKMVNLMKQEKFTGN